MRVHGQPPTRLESGCCFEYVFGAHATIRQLVLSHLTTPQALRQVSRDVRTAVNSNVTTIILDLNAPRCDTELADVFPDANKLRVLIPSGHTIHGPQPTREEAVCALLEHILASSPVLVTKLQALTLSLDMIDAEGDVALVAAVAGFLSRCSSLQELDVDWQDEQECTSDVHFKGEGSTAPEQRASMQRQLAALCSSSAFMAPDSWPACGCLVSFKTYEFGDMTDNIYLSTAARTPSLIELSVDTYNSNSCTPLIGISSLQRLTSLALSSSDDEHDALGDKVLAAMGQLSSLQQLEMQMKFLPGDTLEDYGVGVIPASWSTLSSLTHVNLSDGGAGEEHLLLLSHLSRLVAVEHLGISSNAIAVGCEEALFALTRLTRLDGPGGFVEPDVEDYDVGAGSSSSMALEPPQQWKDGLQHLRWRQYSGARSISMLSHLTNLTFLELRVAGASPDLCRVLGKLTRLTELHLWGNRDPLALEVAAGAAGASEERPTLQAMQRIHLDGFANPLHVLARGLQIPASTKLCFDNCWVRSQQRQLLYIKGWGCSWLPAVLASTRPGGYAVVAVDDSDVDHYLALAAPMSPRQQQAASHVVWLGEEVTPAGFTRLLSCPQQPPLRLEVGTAGKSELVPDALKSRACLTPTPSHFQVLAGVCAPRLVSLELADCDYLTDRDVSMLAAACPALKELRLTGAWRLTDTALHSLAVGCRTMEKVQLTQAARVTAEGVVVALTMLGELRELALGDVPQRALQHLERCVEHEMPAADYKRWMVEFSCGAAECLVTWLRCRQGG